MHFATSRLHCVSGSMVKRRPTFVISIFHFSIFSISFFIFTIKQSRKQNQSRKPCLILDFFGTYLTTKFQLTRHGRWWLPGNSPWRRAWRNICDITWVSPAPKSAAERFLATNHHRKRRWEMWERQCQHSHQISVFQSWHLKWPPKTFFGIANLADQGGCGACTVLLHAPADTMLLAPNPCMANACLRPLHSFPGCNCTSAHIPQIAGYLHISPMVFQCTFCYHAPKVLVFRKFAVSHSFNVVTRNFRFTSKKTLDSPRRWGWTAGRWPPSKKLELQKLHIRSNRLLWSTVPANVEPWPSFDIIRLENN